MTRNLNDPSWEPDDDAFRELLVNAHRDALASREAAKTALDARLRAAREEARARRGNRP